MKFSVSQSALAKAVTVVAKGVASSASQPILAGIKISASEGGLEFQSTNSTTSIRYGIPANVEESGQTVVSGKTLLDVVKRLPDAAVTFDDDGTQAQVTCVRSRFRLNTLDPADFPAFPTLEPERMVDLPSELLSSMVDRVYKVTSKDTSRPILTGVLLTAENNTVRLVATDSYRLAVCDSSVHIDDEAGAFEAIVPGALFHEVLSLPSMTERLQIGLTQSQVVFTFGSTTYVTRRIEGNFPNFRQLLPATQNVTVHFDAQELAQALRRVAVIAQSNPSVRFDIDADGKILKLSASSPDQGEASEIIGVEVEGASVSIALNFNFVLDCVGAISSDADVSLELQGSMQPAVFKSYASINYLYLLMPVRM